jgi:hypothetical protein
MDLGSGFKHHLIPLTWVRPIQDDKLCLNMTKDAAKAAWARSTRHVTGALGALARRGTTLSRAPDPRRSHAEEFRLKSLPARRAALAVAGRPGGRCAAQGLRRLREGQHGQAGGAEMRGRACGTADENAAARFVAEQLRPTMWPAPARRRLPAARPIPPSHYRRAARR